VRGHRLGGILAGRHLLHDHVRQFKIQPACRHRRHLCEGRIGDHDDRPVARLAAMSIDDLANRLLVDARHR
jgi:hypothetical protein